MSEISKNFGTTSPKYITSWSKEILFQKFSDLPIGKLNQVKLNFSFRHGTANTSTTATIRIFSGLNKNWSITGWSSYPASYWWETRTTEQSNEYAWDKNSVNNGSVPAGYQYKEATASNFMGTILAEGDFLITRNTETQVNTTVTFSESQIKQTELSNWNQTLYLAIYSNEDTNNTTWIWPIKFSPTIIFVYSQESNGKLDSSTVNLGSSSTITIAPTNSSYDHKVCWFCGNKNSGWQTVSSGNTSYSYKIPKIWGEEFPSSQNYQGTVQLQTYSGSSLVGTKTYSITYNIPDYSLSINGAISGFTHDISYDNIQYFSDPNFNNKRDFLTSKTKAICTINVNSSKEQRCGADIKSYITRQEDASGNILSSSSSFGFKGDISCSKFYITVIDTRGRTENYSLPLNKITYSLPQITKIEAYRIKSTTDKTKDETGGLACLVKATIVNATSSINGVVNSTTCIINIGDTEISSTEATMALSADESISYTVTVTDTAGAKIVKEGTISSLNYLMHFRKNIQSMGIGCAAPSVDSQLDIAWSVNLKGGIKNISFGGDALSQQSFLATIGALPIAGGTLVGALRNPYTLIYNSNEAAKPSLAFGPDSNTETGSIYQSLSTGSIGISQKANSSTLSENYLFPTPTVIEDSEEVYYNILTTKHPVSIEEGGTGAKNRVDALNNLGILYNSSPTLPTYDKEKHEGVILLVPIS